MERLVWARPLSQTRAVVIAPVKSLSSHIGVRAPTSEGRVLKEILAAPKRGSQG